MTIPAIARSVPELVTFAVVALIAAPAPVTSTTPALLIETLSALMPNAPAEMSPPATFTTVAVSTGVDGGSAVRASLDRAGIDHARIRHRGNCRRVDVRALNCAAGIVVYDDSACHGNDGAALACDQPGVGGNIDCAGVDAGAASGRRRDADPALATVAVVALMAASTGVERRYRAAAAVRDRCSVGENSVASSGYPR